MSAPRTVQLDFGDLKRGDWKCTTWKFGTNKIARGWKWLENEAQKAGRKNAGLENAAQEIQGWKTRDKSVWKANRHIGLQHKSNHYLLKRTG